MVTKKIECYNCNNCISYQDGRLRCGNDLIEVATCPGPDPGKFRPFVPELAPKILPTRKPHKSTKGKVPGVSKSSKKRK